MMKTQIQLPDEMYARLKRLSARLEISMAEILRRGAAYVLSVHAEEVTSEDKWQLPEALDLGLPQVPVENWRALAHEEHS